ncbi:hypothetical protein RT0199 [Rickettsia typhi str. Wilmington]|uniref:Uncharacterized protein n=2 Tax=Rickettsia typhi TaxID=785 RepID=Q68XF9_RICTY|nr:hypothetical protein RT0199 [Rickettsia typhi str. Wilmington]AFE54061.1 hypothetical protein RTTH1527_00980 [Rickettsia typhi str. TH1527]AFE54900.1 hypothetical protein RTB9991CWPP_00985 [Rickettsia typhi str. B9991CWPP]
MSNLKQTKAILKLYTYTYGKSVKSANSNILDKFNKNGYLIINNSNL